MVNTEEKVIALWKEKKLNTHTVESKCVIVIIDKQQLVERWRLSAALQVRGYFRPPPPQPPAQSPPARRRLAPRHTCYYISPNLHINKSSYIIMASH